MNTQLNIVEETRKKISSQISRDHKAKFSQFMTPTSIASFMASMFIDNNNQNCHLLDAGAGIGILSCAFLDRCIKEKNNFTSIKVSAYEIDEKLHNHLENNLNKYFDIETNIIIGDYIKLASANSGAKYTHVILNPPYKKIKSDSTYRIALRKVGIETTNMYSAFLALALMQCLPGGQVIAIIPRSFCNGTYFRLFREYILKHSAIRHIHLFKSRNKVFEEEGILQENIIIHLEREGKQGPVLVSSSTDHLFSDIVEKKYPFNRIVFSTDPEKIIHIPNALKESIFERNIKMNSILTETAVNISTGPIVDFRMRDNLRSMPESGTVPLLYPVHFKNESVCWPIHNSKKPNAIQKNSATEKQLYPTGFYCVVKRFSSKESQRRIMAHVVNPRDFDKYAFLGFENHLNIFHDNKKGLKEVLAYGLMGFLNSTIVDEYFRCFNGLTQVNISDLKKIKYPDNQALMKLGKWIIQCPNYSQQTLDKKVELIIRSYNRVNKQPI